MAEPGDHAEEANSVRSGSSTFDFVCIVSRGGRDFKELQDMARQRGKQTPEQIGLSLAGQQQRNRNRHACA
jgi:hypothetical protein